MNGNIRFAFLAIVSMIFLSFIGCGKSTGSNGNTTFGTDDFDSIVYAPKDASGFKILARPGGKSRLIETRALWQGAENEKRQLLILRDNEELPADFAGSIIKEDAKRIIVLSSGHIAMIDALGNTDRIVGGSALQYVSNPAINQRREELAEIGYDGAYDYEALIAAQPDLVVIYGINGPSPIESKLKELDIPYIYIGDYLESSPLGKSEWIVAIAECVGVREKGEEFFKNIKLRYDALAQEIKQTKGLKHPKVMLNAPYSGTWLMPAAGSYMVRLIEDAGGECLTGDKISDDATKSDNVTHAISDEEALLLLNIADKWLNVGSEYKTISDVNRKIGFGSQTNVVQRGEIYDNTLRSNRNGGNDFYESGILHPDIILNDLICILHPELGKGDLYYYKRLK